MFDDVTKREGGRRAARRFRYLMGSLAAQMAAATVFFTVGIRANVVEGPVVPVTIVRSPAPPGPPLRSPAPKREELRRPGAPPKPRSEGSGPRPQREKAMIQPREPPPELDTPDRGPPPEEEGQGDEEPGSEGGSIGGVTGSSSSPSGSAIGEDSPAYAATGWKRPEQAQRNCVQDSVRIPRGLQGFAAGPVTVKFVIGPDGAPSEFQVLGALPDARIGAAIWQAIRACRWVPGADAQGRPAKIWVTLPIRFVGG